MEPAPEQSTAHGIRQWASVLETAASVAMIVAAVTVTIVTVMTYRSQARAVASAGGETMTLPAQPQPLNDSVILGNRAARVAVIEYSDFECPYCARFAQDTLPVLKAEYIDAGRVQLIFKHLPLAMHGNAKRAAEAAECAGRQSKFWPMHDQLFENHSQLSMLTIGTLAAKTGLDLTAFNTCLNGETAGNVRLDLSSATALGIASTPTFLVGSLLPNGQVKVKQVLSGAQSFQQLKAVLDPLLESNGN